MKYKALLIAGLFVVLLVAGGVYLSSKGRVYIDLANVADGSDITLTVHTNADKPVTKNVRNKSSVTLESGIYIISLKTPNNSLIKTVSVPSFFGTTTVSGNLVNEQQRTFVGTNPSPCVLYFANTFYSASCGDDTSYIQQQVSPTLSSPGYTTKGSIQMSGTLLATSATNSASYALLENYAGDETIRQLVEVSSNLSSTKIVSIPFVADGDVEMAATGTKVLVYSKTMLVGYVYDETTSLLDKVTLPNTDGDYEIMDVSFSNNRIVTTYVESEASDAVDEGAFITGSSKIFVQELGKKNVEYSVSKLYNKVVYCAPNTVCAVGTEGLDVYATQNNSLRKTTSLPGATSISTVGDSVRFIDKFGVKVFDTTTMTGYYDYTFGGYTPCGVSTTVGGYIVCAIDTKNQKHALFVSTQNKAGTDDVDKKVLEILKSNAVSGVAAVNNFIYVIPNYGDVGIFTQDSETTARINQNIDSVIQKSSIPKQQYFVINAGSPL